MIVRRSARRAGAAIRPRERRREATAVVGSHSIVRTGSLLLALLLTTAVAARISDVAVAAHQIAFQIWTFLALALDAIAIAGQALVGKLLGADDEAGARAASRRMLELGIGRRRRARCRSPRCLRRVLVPLFTDEPGGHTARRAGALVRRGAAAGGRRPSSSSTASSSAPATPATSPWPWPAPPCSTSRLVGLVVAFDGGLLMLWAAFSLWVVARLVGMGARFVTDRWLVTGAVRRV